MSASLFELSNDLERLAADFDAIAEGRNFIEVNSGEFGICCNVLMSVHFKDDLRRGVVIESFVGGALESNNENFRNISLTPLVIWAFHRKTFFYHLIHK